MANVADAAELPQNAFMRLLLGIERFELKALRALLRTSARGVVVDHWRREEIERAYIESIAHLSEALAPSAEARALVLELLEDIARLLEGLKPEVRKVFLMVQCDWLTYKLITKQMGISLRSVERYVAEALYYCSVLRYGADE